MEAQNRTITEYLRTDGTSPFREWLQKLRDRQARAQIRVRLNRLRNGNFGDVRSIGGGLSEIRIHHGPGYRIYLGQTGETVVLLLCGGAKSTQRQDIARARERWRDYQRRSK